MEITTALNELIEAVRGKIPANPESPSNKVLTEKLEREMAKYFKSLADAFPYHKLTSLYGRHIEESLSSDASKILDSILAHFDATLKTQIKEQLVETYVSGSAEMIDWGKTKGGIPISYEGPPVSQAINWAERQSAQLVTQMSEETKRRLALTISNSIDSKRGVPGLARDIRKTFDDMSRYRSQLIARTETANALSQASLDRMTEMGVNGKEWVTIGDSEVSDLCHDNEAEGVISINKTFSSGDMAPPSHPNCRCAMAPAMLPKTK